MRVVIYSDDHEPAHVHCIEDENVVVLILDAPEGQLLERECWGFSERDVNRIRKDLLPHIKHLRKEWKRIQNG